MMPTEILHAFYDGGGGASLQDYWDAIRSAPNGGGMFLWSWDDEGMVRGDKGGVMDEGGTGAPDGIVGPYREKEASYYAYKAIYSPVQVGAPDPTAFAGTLTVSNRFDFTDLGQCRFQWQLGWFLDPTDPGENFSTNALIGGLRVGTNSGQFFGPPLPPGAVGTLSLPSFPADWAKFDALRMTATDPWGNNLYAWTWPLRTQRQIRDRILGIPPVSAPAIAAGASPTEIILTNGPRTFHFSKTSGCLDFVTVSNQLVSFGNGPRPVAGTNWNVTSVSCGSDGTNSLILANDLTNAESGFQWKLRPDGLAGVVLSLYSHRPASLYGDHLRLSDQPGNLDELARAGAVSRV